jgi:polyisoprenoid-binding protein YceI
MWIQGAHKLGPDNGTLSVKTGRSGAAAKAGHDLVIQVTSWEATLDVGAASLTLDVDSASLRVIQGTGGMQALGDDDKANIHQTIDEDVLKGESIEFRSTEVELADGRIVVRGDLKLAGATHPVAFDVLVGDDGKLSASALLKQTDWGMKPYSALFGALKVADEVEVTLDAGPLAD